MLHRAYKSDVYVFTNKVLEYFLFYSKEWVDSSDKWVFSIFLFDLQII